MTLRNTKTGIRVNRMVAGLTAVGTAVLGLSLATASPAAAAPGSWRAYGNTNPITSSSNTWKCGDSREINNSVYAQVCAIQVVGGGIVQSAVIVRNRTAALYGADAAARLTDSAGNTLGRWECQRSGVAANSWSVCFGTQTGHNGRVRAAEGGVNGQSLNPSPLV